MQAEDAAMPPPDKRPGGPWIAFLVGALIAVVAVVGYAVYMTGHTRPMDVAVNMPAIRQIPSPTPNPNPAPLPIPLRKPVG